MEVTPLGDSALVIRIDADFERDPEKALVEVTRVVDLLRTAQIPAVTDVVPAFDSVGLFVDPAVVAQLDAEEPSVLVRVRELLKKIEPSGSSPITRGRVIEIPVCYASEFGPDLPIVAAHSGLSVEEVISRHSGAEYRVHCLGFMPGFPFLGGLAAELATPRRSEPRGRVPGGSVAIGGRQTGIYPRDSPGGWNIIGRTSMPLFDPASDSPAFLRPRDRVKFRPISQLEFSQRTS